MINRYNLMSSSVRSMIGGRVIEVFFKPHKDEIEKIISMGCIPVEMAEGSRTYVDDLKIDHHNNLAHQSAAAILALDHYGAAIKKQSSIMVNHVDLDCVMAGVELFGMLPKEICDELAYTVAMKDTDPFNPELQSMPYVQEIAVWQYAMGDGDKNNAYGWLFGTQLLRDIIMNPEAWADQRKRMARQEEERLATALEDYHSASIMPSGRVLLVKHSRCFGFDVHFQRIKENSIKSLNGWKHWVVLAYVNKAAKITISCPNQEIAEAIFGEGGLMNVFPQMPLVDGKEWGGRQAIGGSPRQTPMTEEEIYEAAKLVDNMVLKVLGK